MKTKIIKIGNSQGIRIPKPILEQTGLNDEVEIEVKNQSIIIRSIRDPREGWSEAFKKMAKNNDDKLVDSFSNTKTEWDESEWEW